MTGSGGSGGGARLTHGGGEDDDAEDIHLLAAAGTSLVNYLGGRSQLQVHRPAFRIALIREHVHKVGLDSSGLKFEDGNQVGFILNRTHSWLEEVTSVGSFQNELWGRLTCWNVASIKLDGTMFL